MAANLVEKLQEAFKACEEIPMKEWNAQKQQIVEQFEQLRKAVYEMVDEKTIILSTRKWIQVEKTVMVSSAIELKQILRSEAERIALQYGYSFKTVHEMLVIKNEYNYKCKTEGMFYETARRTYVYWILE